MPVFANPFVGKDRMNSTIDASDQNFPEYMKWVLGNLDQVPQTLRKQLVDAGYAPDSILGGGQGGTAQGGGASAPMSAGTGNMSLPSLASGSASSASPGSPNSMPDPTSVLANAASVADPWANQRGQYQAQLNNLMQGGTSAIAADPSFQNRLQGGQQALERSNAARGYLGSGNILTAISDYGQGKASEEYQNQYTRLSQLAGVNAGSPTASANILAQIPGQNLAYSNSAFQQASQGAMLPYQLQALQQGNTQGAQNIQAGDIQNQLNQQGLLDMQQAARAKQATLLQQLSEGVAMYGGGGSGGGGFDFGQNNAPPINYVNPNTLNGSTMTVGGQTVDQITAQRKALLGLQ